ncbi:Leucine Rich Repeat (LRR)-containing protein [Thiovulum sp. ES]|nr:Leucine Rich Repeat (LRR)-containing protein [Thiovulum sp. ES]
MPFSLKERTYRNLSKLNIRTLPETVEELFSKTTLNLANSQITSLPPEIGNLTQLEALILSGNNLTSLPLSLRNLRKLTYVNISGNRSLNQDYMFDCFRGVETVISDKYIWNLKELPF